MIGNVVGSYKITEKIGEGGMGAVFKGIDMMLEREVAIKMLRPELSSQPEILERFRSEAVTLARLNHPNIATLFSFVRQGEDFFMVMEFVRGQTLDSLLRRSGALPCDKAIALFSQALEGIDHAHRMGIIHRDIKPANMMLTESGTLKVMDFGIARVLGTSRMTRQGNIVGTIAYMSPEQVRGQETDARSDIYSLGILLYEMVTGRVPFSSDSEYDLMRMQIESSPQPPRVFASQIPQSVERAIMRALAKRADARFQGALEFRQSLLGATDTGARDFSSQPTQVVASPGATQPMQGAVPQETRLAADSLQVKQTRLAPEANPAYGYGVRQSQGSFQHTPMPTPSKSNAKLVVGIAAALFVIMIGTAVVLFFLMRKPDAQSAAPASQPLQTTAPSPAPSAGASQPSTPAAPPPQAPPQVEITRPAGESLSGATVTAVENSNATRGAKAARKESSAEAAARKEKERKAAEARRLLNQ